MEEAGLVVDPGGLVWFAHWTPGALAARRFATWFFMARAPEGAVTVDDGEIHEHQWIRPADAMARRDGGEIELIPPTWMTLRLLSEQPTVDATLAARPRPRAADLRHPHRPRGGRDRLDLAGRRGYDDLDTSRPGPRNRLLMLDDGWRVEIS